MIVTLGAEEAIAVFAEGSYFIHPISIPVVSSAVRESMSWWVWHPTFDTNHCNTVCSMALRWRGAILQTLPTADFREEDYHKLLTQIRIEPL